MTLGSRTSAAIAILLGSITVTTLGCRGSASPSTENDNDSKRVVVISPMTHPSLEEAVDGFEAGLREEGFSGEAVTITYLNASGDFSRIPGLTKLAVAEEPDVILVLTTPAAADAIKVTNEAAVPLVYTAVTDPVSAKVVTGMESSSTYATGVSDRYPVDEQVKLFALIMPEMRSAAILYNPDEENSRILAKQTITALRDRSLNPTEYHTRVAADIAGQVKLALRENDCLIINGDNLLTDNLQLAIHACRDAQKPLFVGDPDSVRQGAVATVGPSYYSLGRTSGHKAAAILAGADPRRIPSEYPTDFDYIINTEAAQAMGVTIPLDCWNLRSIWSSTTSSKTR